MLYNLIVMTGDGPKPDSVDHSETPDNTFVILGTLADTTWRMFVPSVGFTLLGVWLDSLWDTKPWAMTVGIVVGVLGAYLLVAKQIKTIRRGSKP